MPKAFEMILAKKLHYKWDIHKVINNRTITSIRIGKLTNYSVLQKSKYYAKSVANVIM